MLKIKGKFYIGSRSVILEGTNRDGENWIHPTLTKAIEHAKERVDETREDQYIVQVIRVVRYKDMPIIVEKV